MTSASTSSSSSSGWGDRGPKTLSSSAGPELARSLHSQANRPESSTPKPRPSLSERSGFAKGANITCCPGSLSSKVPGERRGAVQLRLTPGPQQHQSPASWPRAPSRAPLARPVTVATPSFPRSSPDAPRHPAQLLPRCRRASTQSPPPPPTPSSPGAAHAPPRLRLHGRSGARSLPRPAARTRPCRPSRRSPRSHRPSLVSPPQVRDAGRGPQGPNAARRAGWLGFLPAPGAGVTPPRAGWVRPSWRPRPRPGAPGAIRGRRPRGALRGARTAMVSRRGAARCWMGPCWRAGWPWPSR